MVLARGRTPLESAYMYHKLSDMSEDICFVLASTMDSRKASRPALLRSLANHLLGMMNLFFIGMEPITTTTIDLSTLCPCNALGHVCQIPSCTAQQHVCVAVGLTARDSLALDLGGGIREMPPPTICPGSCRLPHGLRAADIVCAAFFDDSAAHADNCLLGHDQPALRRAVLEKHRRLCPVARKAEEKRREEEEAVEEEEKEQEEGREPPSSSGRRNPVGAGLVEDGSAQENARPELAESSRKRSLWNLRAFRK
ncbi:hypothetical protein BC567DRAFT_221230 [Phyllosticta citribraziliensis]